MRILIAEDDASSRRLLEAFLAKWGYEVLVANQGEEAWQLLQRDDAPKLAILDWMMPGMDGLEICREAKKRFSDAPLYILLLTTRDQPEDLMQAFEAGADDYLNKPFNPQELKARLHAGGRILAMQDQLVTSQRRLEAESARDPVTGLWNRAAVLDMLRRELARATRQASSLGVALAELDGFAAFVDTHGGTIANLLLREVAARLRDAVRYYDTLGRYGEGSFLVIAPEAHLSGALTLANRLRTLIARKPLSSPEGDLPATLSLGVAVRSEARGGNAEDLLGPAHEALARAKARGGNCVEPAAPES